MVSTRRSSFSVPSLPTSSSIKGRPPTPTRNGSARAKRSAAAPVSKKREAPLLPPRPPKPPLAPPASKQQKQQKQQDTATSNNFLQDFNVENCSDLLSLPDPPSPGKRRQQRRLSSPLQDLTNNSITTASPGRSSKQQSYKRRQSIGHVSSPVMTHTAETSSSLQTTALHLSGAKGSAFSKPNRRQSRQSLGHVPSPIECIEKITTISSTTASHESSWDLSGADMDDSYLTSKRKSRRSLAQMPSPVVSPAKNSDNKKENLEPSSLDLSYALLADDLPQTAKRTKKYRQSLGHVPSPIFYRQDEEVDSDFNCTITTGANSQLDFSDACSTNAAGKPQRRKKRQSFFVPSNDSDSDATLDFSGVAEFSELMSTNDAKDADEGILREASTVLVETKRRKKRQSFFVPSNDLEVDREVESILDFSGAMESENATDTAENDENSSVEFSKSSSKSRKKRQSFFMPPDDMHNTTNDAHEVESLLSNDQGKSIVKRHKKRQSILLPSDSDQGERTDITEYFENLAKYGAEIKETEPEAVATTGNIPDTVVIQSKMASIRQLVRSYCSLQTDERGSSDAARDLQKLTGYPLVPRPKLAAASTGMEAFARKQQLFSELGPIVEGMDKGKEAERKVYEQETGYRAEKTRSGRYRYFSNATNKRITPLEYEQIYLPKLQEATVEKSVAIKEFLEEFDKEVFGANRHGSDEHHDRHSNEEPSDDGREEDAMDSEGDDGVGKSVGNEDDNMEIDDSPCAAIEDAVEEHEREDEGFQHVVSASAKALTRQLVLPLPPRDEVSSDPDIAQAHRKLWGTIDDALDAYSRTVFAIEAAKEFAKSE